VSAGAVPPALALCGALFLAGCAALGEPARSREPAPISHDGLLLAPNPSGAGVLFVRPDHQIGSYDALMLDPVTVSYRRETRLPPRAETERIRRHLRSALERGIGRSGIPISGDPGTCVLRVGIFMLDTELFEVPQDAAAKTSFVASWGRFVLVYELRDSLSGEALMRYAVKRSIPGGAYYGATGSRNWAAIEGAIDGMLADLRESTTDLLPETVGEARQGCQAGIASAATRRRATQAEAGRP